MALKRAGAVVLVGRLLQLATGAILALLLPRVMPAADVGAFFLAQVAIAIAAVVAQGGLTFVLPGTVGEALTRGDAPRAGAICAAALRLWALASLALGAATALLGWLWPAAAAAWLGVDRTTLALVPAIAALAALGALLAEMHRARGAIALASLLPNAQGLAAAAFGVVVFVAAATTSPAAVLVAGLVGVATAASVALSLLQRHLHLRPASDDPRATVGGLSALAWPALATSVGTVAVALADQSIAGVVGGAVEAAHYGLGLRLASLLALPLGIVNVTLTPRIVALWTTGERAALQALLGRTSRLSAAGALVGVVGLVGLRALGPAAIWGEAYAPALTIAVILGVGQAIQAGGGSSGHLLMLLGEQKAVMQVSLSVGALAVASGIAAMAWGGGPALAAVMAIANAGQTIAHVILARRRLGLATWPGAVAA